MITRGNKLKPLINQEKHQQDISQNQTELKQSKEVSTHKYPFLHDEYVSVEDLKNRVYKSTVGVLPVRQSQRLKELNFIMKGQPINKQQNNLTDLYENESDDASDDEEDLSQEQEDDELDSSDDDDDVYKKIHANLNTPVTSAIGDALSANQTPVHLFKENFDFGLKDRQIKPKPAILAKTGTTGQAKLSERPKPIKKDTTLTIKSPRKIFKPNEKPSFETQKTEASEADLQQADLENQMRELINDAKGIAGSSKPVSPDKNSSKKLKQPSGIASKLDSTATNQKEKVLLSTVEGLITAIKSGQIMKEQEESNKRIKDILMTILDKDSLEAFESVFERNTSALVTESERIKLEEESLTAASEYEKALAAMSQENITKEQQSVQHTSIASKSFREDSVSLLYESSARHTSRSGTSYDDEVNAYLASLPLEVTRTDVLNTQAKRAKLFEKEITMKELRKRSELKELTTEEKYAKNLHLFCMLEHERRNSLLLPNELINVTRKFHTKNKFESNVINNLN